MLHSMLESIHTIIFGLFNKVSHSYYSVYMFKRSTDIYIYEGKNHYTKY